jgi:ERO1-like protein beta
MCDYETVESVNEELFNNLSELVRLPFFKYFRVRFTSTVVPAHSYH